jgi:hypothetical protein
VSTASNSIDEQERAAHRSVKILSPRTHRLERGELWINVTTVLPLRKGCNEHKTNGITNPGQGRERLGAVCAGQDVIVEIAG